MKRLLPIVISLVSTLVGMPVPANAQDGDSVAPGYKHDINIRGIGEGPYNLKASVKPKMEVVPMGLAKKGQTASSNQLDKEEIKKRIRRDVERWFMGSAPDDLPLFDPTTTGLVNDLVDSKEPLGGNSVPGSAPTTPTSPMSSMDPEAHHHAPGGGGPEDHHKLPTDGSPGSEDITVDAITAFYESLPRDITYRLAGMGTDPMATVHGAGDPFAPYAIAMSRGDFLRMRQYAQDEAVTNLRDRIAMLGLAGATALRSMNNPRTTDKFPAKDTLRKVAEDLHYAGQGLDETKPNEAKLKAVCEDISRIWSNMNQPKANN